MPWRPAWARTKKMSFREIRKMTSQKMLRIIATRDLGRLAIAGTVMGAGIVLMHYLGMESVEFPGRILYDPGLVAASVVIAEEQARWLGTTKSTEIGPFASTIPTTRLIAPCGSEQGRSRPWVSLARPADWPKPQRAQPQ